MGGALECGVTVESWAEAQVKDARHRLPDTLPLVLFLIPMNPSEGRCAGWLDGLDGAATWAMIALAYLGFILVLFIPWSHR